MSVVVSASRRTDLAASFPDVLARALREEKTRVLGPAGRSYEVDLRPVNVHTLVLWSKDFANLLADRSGLKGLVAKYEQAYFHFTITGLGGTSLEKGVLPPDEAMAQLPGTRCRRRLSGACLGPFRSRRILAGRGEARVESSVL